MKNRFKKLSGVVFSLVLLMALSLTTIYNVHAADKWSFSVSPMKEKILLNPGEQYSSSVTVYVQEGDNTDIRYKVEVEGFYVDENYTNVFAECGTYCEMKDWITIESPTEGRLSPGGKTEIKYTINVPKDAPGGGQYASIIVQGDPWTDESGDTEDDDDKDEMKSGFIPKPTVALEKQSFLEETEFPAIEITYLAVERDRRGQGIGEFIINQVEKKVLRDNPECEFITVEAYKTKDYSAVGFYARCHFTPAEPPIGYKDTLRMYKVLHPTILQEE